MTKLLGIVTLYNPDPTEATANIKRYVGDLDKLIIWDNTPLEKDLKSTILGTLSDFSEKIIWNGNGKNHFIAYPVNYAWNYAIEQGYELLLIMDQDSKWDHFALFRKEMEECYAENCNRVFCPYIIGNDTFGITKDVQEKKVFINSGSVIPIKMLESIGGADEAFALDALDHDLSIRFQKAGYSIVCLTQHLLYHSVGDARRMGPFNLFTNNYGPERTYSMAKSHIIKYRKHKDWLTFEEKKYIIKEYYILKLLRIILAEPQKWIRFKMFIKGIYDGLTYDLSKHKYND